MALSWVNEFSVEASHRMIIFFGFIINAYLHLLFELLERVFVKDRSLLAHVVSSPLNKAIITLFYQETIHQTFFIQVTMAVLQLLGFLNYLQDYIYHTNKFIRY